jgi:hypothetical protein
MMPKPLLFCLFLVTSAFSYSQEPQISSNERVINLSTFINLKIYSGIEVKLIPSQENKVIISGEARQDVVAKIKGQTLKLRHTLEHILNPSFTYIELFHSEPLDEISLYQGTKLETDHTYQQTSIFLKVQEGSTMRFKFEGEKLTSLVSTGGQLFLSGRSTTHHSVVNSGGACEAETFITEQTKTSVTAGGLSYVNATKLIEAKVTAGGTIRIHGKPQKLVTKKAIGGQIFEME